MSDPHPDRRFPTTQWSLVMRLKSVDAKEAQQAVHDIFTAYRFPLYGYLRSSGLGHEDAEDVLQGFFEKMLRTDSLGLADPARGKLRTFLLTALSRFKSNFQRGEQRRLRRFKTDADASEVNQARWERESHPTHKTPDHYYDRQWAAELIQHVRNRLRHHYEQRGRQELHDALVPFLGSEDLDPTAFLAIPARLNMSEGTLRVALSRLRKDFRELLLKEVKRTLDDGEDARAEIQHLLGSIQE
jgi:DNA-directed RNA polymerase specialized sigma24 family protein